ncbi:hypothetical protein G8B25_00750 [Lactobacillus delbrueckii]|uniref:hypothetical protein n=1 Tax=Lactobacillus delbrueckii TaxID=1584 RepID=UPI001780BB7B|nr:hypothetical protein [Lactobacillus delbrueckii]MCD5436174.1 hypothetical protein [Lactobacillus delbrueckii subsp. lactis]MDD1332615.1 hypothetical protein [Lactobacillus delbrueckii subsp. lactis]UNL38003.1 hypothetical protein G8B25_00750 [Lactobacillus delbrueckii]
MTIFHKVRKKKKFTLLKGWKALADLPFFFCAINHKIDNAFRCDLIETEIETQKRKL